MAEVRERAKWIRVCLTCEGNGSVVDEDEFLWVCPTCSGSGEEPDSGEYFGV